MIARKSIVLSVAALTSLGMAALAHAGGLPTVAGGTWMQFSNAVSAGGTNPIVNGASRGTASTVQFGVGAPVPANNPNVFTFQGLNNFTGTVNENFVLGNVSYFNGITSPGPQSVDGALNIIFDDPASLGTRIFNFNFTFTITTNTTGDPVLDADILNFSSLTSATNIQIDGLTYTLFIAGFQNAGGTFTSLTLPEGQTANAQILARFVPTPSATALLGLGGLIAFRRRR